MFKLLFGILLFGLASTSFAYDEYTKKKEEQEKERVKKIQEESIYKGQVKNPELLPEAEQELLVEVEPSNVLPSDLSNVYILVPYKVRRESWGLHFSLSYSLYEPKNYESTDISVTVADFETLYGGSNSGLVELGFNFKKNFFMGSLGGEIYLGQFTSSSNNNVDDANLSLQFYRLGAKFTLDNMSNEPFIVPYFAAGIYLVQFNESDSVTTFSGNTSPGFYYTAGVLFQLDWIDKAAAREAYFESGLENTFVFLEARQFLETQDERDPDFTGGIHFNTGLTLEF